MLYQIISTVRMLLERNKVELAQQKLLEGMTMFPDSSDLHAIQAEIYFMQDEPRKALQATETAIGYNPENDYFFYLKARAHLDLDQESKAEKAISRSLEMNPQCAYYYGMKAAILVQMERREEAISLARQGLEVDSEDIMCNNVLSMALNKSGRTEEAFERLESVLENDPENILTHTNFGYHYLRQGNIPKAKEHFANALREDPTYEFARAGMIQAIKATNFAYRKLLDFGFWMDKIGRRNRWMFMIGLIVVINIIPFLLPFYLIFIMWTWFTPPISDMVLYFDKYGRYLMTPENLKLTQVNIGLTAASLTCALVIAPFGVVTEMREGFWILALGLFLSILPIYFLDRANNQTAKLLNIGTAVLFIGAGAFGAFLGTNGSDPSVALMALAFGAVGYSWLHNFVK